MSTENPLRRFSSLLGLAAGVVAGVLIARYTNAGTWSWVGGAITGIAVASVVSRLLYGFADARALDRSEAGDGSYASRSIIGNITDAPPPVREPEAETKE